MKTISGEQRLIVDFVVPYTNQKEIHRFLDPKVPPPTPLEMEALAFIASLALDCVSESVLRPSMTKVANSLQSALEGIWKGKVIAGGKRMVCNTTVCAAEVKGIGWAILLSQELNLRKVVAEGDSKDLYQCY
nr:serine/threonine-protein kinase-like protein ccr4 [Quercus suber]